MSVCILGLAVLRRKISVPLLTVIVFTGLTRLCVGQTFDKMTDAHIIYWRAFHGTITQDIRMAPRGKTYFQTRIVKAYAKERERGQLLTIDIPSRSTRFSEQCVKCQELTPITVWRRALGK